MHEHLVCTGLRRLLAPLTSKLLMVGLASFCVGWAWDGRAVGDLLYANAAAGPPSPLGLAIGGGQIDGMRFHLSSGAVIDGIGGNLQVFSTPGNHSIYGALVRLTSMSDYPDSVNLSTPDVLLGVNFTASADLTEVIVPTAPLTVPAGDYALLFGSDLFGASGVGSMSTYNDDYPDSSVFIYSPICNSWEEYGPYSGLRFTVYGTTVPEPEPASLMVFLAVVFAGLRILKCHSLHLTPGPKS